MGGTLKSKMRCGCEFWEMLNYMGEEVPEFIPCKKHGSIRKRQLEAEAERLRKDLQIADDYLEEYLSEKTLDITVLAGAQAFIRKALRGGE
jgi:hypothetical protein